MVSGNSMAHVYLGLDSRTRRPSGLTCRTEWSLGLAPLLSHPAIDLVASRRSPSMRVEVRRGGALRRDHCMGQSGILLSPVDGNPLGIEPFEDCAMPPRMSDLRGHRIPGWRGPAGPLVLAERSGDLVVSAAPGWDLRRRYEPIDHVSSHGALHAAHMLVPLVGNRRIDPNGRDGRWICFRPC